jgi:hypothetical protein
MKFGLKLIAVAVIALSVGVAFASPMLYESLNVKLLPRVPEGPKADFSVSIIYANFSIVNGTVEENVSSYLSNYTRTRPYTNVTYMVVMNVTNLSDLYAKISEVSFTAAENISVIPSALGGYSAERAGGPGINSGGVVDGVWLDDKWVNVTWIPNVRNITYPESLFFVITAQHTTVDTIPDLPPNATEKGTWIEGAPIAEYYDNDSIAFTEVYINGSWVNYKGTVRTDHAKATVMATHSLANRVQNFGGLLYKNAGNASVGPITELPSWHMYNGNGPSFKWISTSGFNNTWAPNESRLIMLSSTLFQTYSHSSQRSSLDAAIASLAAGKIDLYASVSSYINNWLVNGTYYDTTTTATWLQQVQMTDTLNGYLYNTALGENQIFQTVPNSPEVFIVPRS